MTLVVTFTGGFLGCFTVNPDGSMRQRALIDTGTDTPSPQELAETGMVLANEYGWQVNGVQPVAPTPVKKALPQPAAKRNRKYPPTDVKRKMILDYLNTQGPSTLHDILRGSHQPSDNRAKGNWYHIIKALINEGQITATRRPRKAGEFNPPQIYELKG